MDTQAAIGIDFGGTTIKSAIVEKGVVLQRGAIIDTQGVGDSTALITALEREIAHLRAQHGNIVALGIGLPGLVDSAGGIVHRLSNVPGWTDVPLRDLLRRRTGLAAMIENDANAMAYGEWKYGAARDGTNVVCITLGTGVGGGLILNGELYRGSNLGAGEVGQMSIDLRGRPGNYGNLGALEKYVGNVQITERAHAFYARSAEPRDLGRCTPAELSTAARAGDPIALGIWQEVGTEIGAALASVVWLLNPDAIVIGGGIANAGELVFEPIRRTIAERTISVLSEELNIVPAQLGNDAGIIGSAELALDTAR